MYIRLKCAPEIEISKELEIKINGYEINLTNLITVTIYGITNRVEPLWLYLIALFKVELPDTLKDKIFDISFKKIESYPDFFPNGYLMVFKEPLHLHKDFRIVPGYTSIAINNYGLVWEWKTNRFLYANPFREYPNVSVERRSAKIHRLVAFAWVYNDDYENKPIINHIDGDKTNQHASNIEWCNYKDNLQHAFDNDLNNIQYGCKVYDIVTKEIYTFPSINEAKRQLKSSSIRTYRNFPGTLFDGRYELKMMDDDSDWIYTNSVITEYGKSRIFIINDGNGSVTYRGLTGLRNTFKISSKLRSYDDVIDKIKSKYPDIKIHEVNITNRGPYQAKNIATGEVFTAISQSKLGEMINKDWSWINGCLEKDPSSVSDGYLIRYYSEDPWPEANLSISSNKIPIYATNTITSEVINFKSKTAAAKHFDITESLVTKLILKNIKYGEYSFNYNSGPL